MGKDSVIFSVKLKVRTKDGRVYQGNSAYITRGDKVEILIAPGIEPAGDLDDENYHRQPHCISLEVEWDYENDGPIVNYAVARGDNVAVY